MRLKAIAVLFLSFVVSAQALVTFTSGQVAKAEDFNTNFSELNDMIETIQNDSSSTTSGSTLTPNAKVNGIDMYVQGFALGYYSIKTPTENYITVNSDGLPLSGTVYFESNDCTGQGYMSTSLEADVNVGHTYVNPKVGAAIVITYLSGSTVYADFENIIKLNYNSIKYISSDCRESSGSTIASIVKPNNIDITGISFPAIITEIGTNLTVSDEIGSAEEIIERTKIVYANGNRIGVTSYFSLSADLYVRVVLDDYPNQTVNLYKDGTYTGFDFGVSQNLYYSAADCTGNAYAKVLNDFNKEWWFKSELINVDVVNNDRYYRLSSTIYKMTNGTQSYMSSYNGTCYNSVDLSEDGYKLATEISTPSSPVFQTPITIEDVSEDISYDSLPEAN